MAAALEVLLGIDTGLAIDKLGPAFVRAADIMRLRLQDNRAVIGKNAFRHVSGISISGYLKSPLAAQPVETDRLGRRSRVILGKASGRAAVEHELARLGVGDEQVHVGELVDSLKATAERHRRVLSTADLLRAVHRQQAEQAAKPRTQRKADR